MSNNLSFASTLNVDNSQLSIIDYYVIGISNNPHFILSDEVKKILKENHFFSGGKRHYELVQNKLPIIHHWIEINKNITTLFNEYKKATKPIIVFASGDPLFYGFANTIKKYHPNANIKVYPTFNSLQLLCHKNTISYQNIVNTSVHGRSWQELDIALIKQSSLIGILTDTTKNPNTIAQRMLDYNFDHYKMIVGEALDAEQEKITSLSLIEAAKKTFDPLNCILLIKEEEKQKKMGISDVEFIGLENRPNMITKMPIRLISLSQLDLYNRKTLWDIGFCTGSVSIEAKTQFPHLNIIAFEKREECSIIFDINTKKHSTPGITKIIHDFFKVDLKTIPTPDSVFIGGHGNKLEALISLIDKYLISGGKIVINAVKKESKETFIKTIKKFNYHLLDPIEINLDSHNPITILTAEKKKNE
ncbi:MULTISPECIES: precorrin-6y C5,15-methyltransferase (decarboxylating) subunit CbiE [Flavobacterium]|uniref:Precorrin-6y C5,15-methyltransferase (Decarboxylating) subunit CbiE n=1 Tax=Flavobacterium columnare TaxID=996 RepID=A0A437U8S5_9FLAO|nr:MULTISPECIES: precorrin-6y C5,15-methyltransferase (decarboxylating) subunit CbiE [Flavobacterium]QYS88770.1 precorrin-6y C5,15-methyltransferase (decarboxylating) subunit CbiE [Flavobacterium davisii]RVU89948.1 precorrin-6y C5,15-methyltransferase (decarboxylating) subunit CbiE [Flavobacterium columnare]